MMTKANAFLSKLVTPLVFALLPMPVVHATTAAELIANAPVLVIGLDNSGSSPATSPAIVGGAWPEIESQIRRMPMAATIKIYTIGDASAPYVSPPPLRIQKKLTENGGPVEHVVAEVKKTVLAFPERVKGGAIPEHSRSELIGGFNDASKLLNKNAKGNVVIFVSDLIENSGHANCYKDTACRLPAPTFSLEGAEVTVIGVGMGFPASRAMPLTFSWLQFLKAAGASTSIDKLRRVN
jgi:hypothetical protein